MNTVEFDFIREQVKEIAGMTFAPDKGYLVASRLAAVGFQATINTSMN